MPAELLLALRSTLSTPAVISSAYSAAVRCNGVHSWAILHFRELVLLQQQRAAARFWQRLQPQVKQGQREMLQQAKCRMLTH
jgi:hypothetical protein